MSTESDRESVHILEQRRPQFLDLLDSDPHRSLEEFYRFARTLLFVSPPQNLWGVPEATREDVIHDLILQFAADDFRLLRKYQDRGKPFSAWFALVSRNKITDWLRVHTSREKKVSTREELPEHAASSVSPADRALDRVVLEKVLGHVDALGEICRLLLMGAAEGMRPRELVRLVGWPDDWNKKASDDLRECRKRLRKSLLADGLDPAELAGPS